MLSKFICNLRKWFGSFLSLQRRVWLSLMLETAASDRNYHLADFFLHSNGQLIYFHTSCFYVCLCARSVCVCLGLSGLWYESRGHRTISGVAIHYPSLWGQSLCHSTVYA